MTHSPLGPPPADPLGPPRREKDRPEALPPRGWRTRDQMDSLDLLRDISVSLRWILGLLLFFFALTILAICGGLWNLGK